MNTSPPSQESSRSLPGVLASALRRHWLTACILFLICCVAFFLRTYFLYEQVLGGDIVQFQDNDPWYHYRVLQWQVRNLPYRFMFDPYAIFPGGQGAPVGPFFDLSLASVIWAISLGSPSQALIDVAAACYAPVLAVLVCLTTYAAGRAIFDRWAGLIAAAAVGILPGSFFIRSSLGFLDHHVMEVLLSTAVLWLLALAFAAQEGDGAKNRRSMVAALAAGVALGCYLLTWVGGNFLIVILVAWGVVQHVRDQFSGRPGGYLWRSMVPCFCAGLVVLAFYIDYAWGRLQVHGLIGGIAVFLLLGGLSALRVRRGWGPVTYLLVLIGLAVCCIGGAYAAAPGMVSHIVNEFGRLAPGATARTITEARPINWTGRGYSWMPVWEFFGTTLPIAVVGLVMLGVSVVRRPGAPRLLLVVWSAIVLAAMFGQARFSYYASPVIALLVGWVCTVTIGAVWNVSRSAGREPRMAATRTRSKGANDKIGGSERGFARRGALVVTGVAAVFVVAVSFVPSMLRLPVVVRFYDGPTSEWSEALVWLRDHSPEPFGSADAYYAMCTSSEDAVQELDHTGAYGVMSWWDYGYWISGIARRAPNSNPTQAGAVDSAKFLLAQSEDEACALLDRAGSRYVVLDWMLPRWEKPGDRRVRGKFSAFPVWTGQSLNDFYERVSMKDADGRTVRQFLYYPAYFQSALIRMFIFSCGSVGTGRPVRVYTLSAPGATVDGLRVVTSVREFETHDAASAFVRDSGDRLNVIASESPFVSCVPMPALRRLRLVHRSPKEVATIHGRKVSPVAVFEYVKD